MSLEILSLVVRPNKLRIGVILVKYHDLVIKCDLVYSTKFSTCWVRMPEMWLTRETKVSYCYWDTKQVSDDFQKDVLNKVFDTYDLGVDKVAAIHKEYSIKRAATKWNKKPVDASVDKVEDPLI